NPLIESFVFDLFPIAVDGVGLEFRAVVGVVAGVAVSLLGVCEREADFFASGFLVTGVDQLDVPAAGAVTVLAAVVEELRRSLFTLEPADVTQHVLRMPAGHMAGEAFGVMNARDPTVLQ